MSGARVKTSERLERLGAPHQPQDYHRLFQRRYPRVFGLERRAERVYIRAMHLVSHSIDNPLKALKRNR